MRRLPKPDQTNILKFKPHYRTSKHSGYVKKGYQTKLTQEQARAILVLRPEGKNWNQKAIALAQLLNVSSTTIYGIWSRKRWKNLDKS